MPEIIADNLLADAGSALSSTLQVLLTKMWERARAAPTPTDPRFDRALYESLKAEGYLLKDVLDEGLKAIGRWNSGGRAIRSGTRCARLSHDRPRHGRRRKPSRTGRALRAPSSLRFDGLLGRFKDHYLLIEAEPRPDSPDPIDPTGPRPARALGPATVSAVGRPRSAGSPAAGEPGPEWRDGKTGSRPGRARPGHRRERRIGNAGPDGG